MQNNAQLVQMIYRFLAYIKARDGEETPFSFQNRNTFLGREENYKAVVFSKAQEALQLENWNEEWVESRTILSCMRDAMACAGNLVYRFQQMDFRDRIDPASKAFKPNSSRVLYDVYTSRSEAEEREAYDEAVKTFGGSYDVIGYLFFIKDQSRFLPISPGNFEKSLASVGIQYKLSGRCSWENYNGFIDIIKTVQSVLQDILPTVDIRLIDAHSFLWVISEGKRETDFLNWEPDTETVLQIEEETERYLQRDDKGIARKKTSLTSYFARSAEVVKMTKARANGICQLCGNKAPFYDRKGEPYLETHHIVWLSRGGSDSPDNTAALCPNCHARMHVVNDEKDVQKLKSVISSL